MTPFFKVSKFIAGGWRRKEHYDTRMIKEVLLSYLPEDAEIEEAKVQEVMADNSFWNALELDESFLDSDEIIRL